MATSTHPDQWWDTDDRVLVTVLDVLAKQAARASGKGGDDGGD